MKTLFSLFFPLREYPIHKVRSIPNKVYPLSIFLPCMLCVLSNSKGTVDCVCVCVWLCVLTLRNGWIWIEIERILYIFKGGKEIESLSTYKAFFLCILTVEIEDSYRGLWHGLVRIRGLADKSGIEMMSMERRVFQVIDQNPVLPINPRVVNHSILQPPSHSWFGTT